MTPMREDKFTRTEADAAAYEAIRAHTDGPEPSAFVEVPTPYCKACQRGTKDYLCGPCQRELWRAQTT